MSIENNKYIPITIETNEVLNEIDMFAYEFENLVRSGKYKIVFRSPDVFFISKDGFCFCTPHFELVKTYEDFLVIINELKDNGFTEPIEYEEAMRLDILSINEYKEFKESKFYGSRFLLHNSNTPPQQIRNNVNINRSKYEKYLAAKKAGFESEQDYDKAKQINCENSQLYFEFLESDFLDDRRYRNNNRSYEEFLKAKQMGFRDKETYNNAIGLGFKDVITYEQFIESGCENREEFEKVIEFQKSLPDFVQKEQNKIKAIKKDAQRALDSQFLEEYIRLNYLHVEKLSKLTYVQLYKVPLDATNDLNVEEIFHKIEEKTGKDMIDYGKLHEWRTLRNKIAHDHVKIDEATIVEAKSFFNFVISNLEGYA